MNQLPRHSEAVTKSDTYYLKPPRSLYVGGVGDLNVLLQDDADSNDPNKGTVFKLVTGVFPYAVKKVFATGTDASDIVATW